MKIQLESWKVRSLDFSILDKQRKENSFELKTSQEYDLSDDNKFAIDFTIQLKDKQFNLNIQSRFIFSSDSIISEEFRQSNFPKINAPAISFPYIRAFISNFTLQAGFNPIILPSLNFVKLAEKD